MNWIFIAIGAIPTLIISVFLHNLDVNQIEKSKKLALANQVQIDRNLCQKIKNITTKSESFYETQIVQRNADIKRLSERPMSCIDVTGTSSKRDAIDQRKQSHNPDGIVAAAKLYDFAGECEIDRIKVITLQQFIKDERDAIKP